MIHLNGSLIGKKYLTFGIVLIVCKWLNLGLTVISARVRVRELRHFPEYKISSSPIDGDSTSSFDRPFFLSIYTTQCPSKTCGKSHTFPVTFTFTAVKHGPMYQTLGSTGNYILKISYFKYSTESTLKEILYWKYSTRTTLLNLLLWKYSVSNTFWNILIKIRYLKYSTRYTLLGLLYWKYSTRNSLLDILYLKYSTGNTLLEILY